MVKKAVPRFIRVQTRKPCTWGLFTYDSLEIILHLIPRLSMEKNISKEARIIASIQLDEDYFSNLIKWTLFK